MTVPANDDGKAVHAEDRPLYEVRSSVLLSVFPPDSELFRHLSVAVEWRGRDAYAIVHNKRTLNRAGEWEYETQPSSRTDEYLATSRFSYEDALTLARAVVPRLTLMGLTADQWLVLEALSEQPETYAQMKRQFLEEARADKTRDGSERP